ncbi:MAG: TetR family transcriptional regulator [Deltaproteobacteria bacterium]|nr:TetR family transcriptional regulator [Deltaproteobacteria bacterium]
MSRRVSAEDWSAAGLALLRDEGVEALTVDRLCAALRRTKGSFYHHFRDLDGYLAALLRRWEAELTEAPIRAAAGEPDPARRGAKLDAVVRGLDHRLDCAVRDWARRDPRARAAMERIDRRRIDAIAAIHRAAGRRDARLLASLEYVAFVGAQQLGLLSAPARAARLSRALRRALQRMSGGR